MGLKVAGTSPLINTPSLQWRGWLGMAGGTVLTVWSPLGDEANPPTGRLGILHFGIQKWRASSAIPQPEGWGSFTSAYIERPMAR